jgi:hypothetical protein
MSYLPTGDDSTLLWRPSVFPVTGSPPLIGSGPTVAATMPSAPASDNFARNAALVAAAGVLAYFMFFRNGAT